MSLYTYEPYHKNEGNHSYRSTSQAEQLMLYCGKDVYGMMLVKKAQEVRAELQKVTKWIAWDDNGNIGKRYRRQDEIGTPVCITIDFDTLEDDTVTVRDRDTGEQKRVKIANLKEVIG